MPAPTPLHRDPEADGDDYGCVRRNAAKGNTAIANLVADVRHRLNNGEFVDDDELLCFVQAHLKKLDVLYDCGCCDTIVKENVFAALRDAMAKAGVEVSQMDIYWW